MKHFWAFLFCVSVCVSFLVVGCGGSDGGASDWAKSGVVTIVSNIQGKIALPSASVSVRALFSLLSPEGTRVFVESKPEFYAIADAEGSFIIKSVPAGKYRIIADIKTGDSTYYRQRSDIIDLSGNYETQIVPDSIALQLAPHRLKMHVSNVNTGSPVEATITVWGFTSVAVAGSAEIGPLPAGSHQVRVDAVGYSSNVFLIGFDELKQSELHVKLTPLTSTVSNKAPVVELSRTAETIRTGESATFYASGIDPDGDSITYSWQASKGVFSNQIGAMTVFTAPSSSGTVTITLAGKDPDGAEGKALLNLDVLAGSTLPSNPSNRSPVAASDPVPANLSENMGGEVVLRWSASDPDGDVLNYDVLFAPQGSDLQLVAQNIASTAYSVKNLAANKTYLWRIIVRDVYDAMAQNPQTWQFKTGNLNNLAPYKPDHPTPEDMSLDQLTTMVFTWTGGDPDAEDILTYRFLMGTDKNQLELKGTTRNARFSVENLEQGKTYYWQIIAADDRGMETAGEIWAFTTYPPSNQQPSDPVIYAPALAAVDVAINTDLQWSASDPDGDAVTFELFVGKETPLTKVASGLTSARFQPAENFEYLTKYYWQVIVRDDKGLANANSPVWSFTTAQSLNLAPNKPVAINPAANSIEVPRRPTFSWSGGDPDGDAVAYDLYYDTLSPPTTLRAENLSAVSWTSQSDLNAGGRYYWKIVARDSHGSETSSDIFSFVVITDTEIDLTPPTLVSVSPANGAVSVSADSVVTVVFNEPVNKVAAEAAFSFVPSSTGVWTWTNASSVAFRPSNAWLPGSYRIFKIADGAVRDLAANIMTTGGNYAFTIASQIPVPAGCRSLAFPVKPLADDSITVYVPGLASQKKSWALAVAAPGPATFTVRASVVDAIPEDIDPHAAFRFFERQLTNCELPAFMKNPSLRRSVVPLAAPVLDEEEEFYIPSYGSVATTTAYPNNVITAKCVALTDKIAVFADNAIQAFDMDLAAEVRSRFEGAILPTVRDVFGEEPSTGPDGDSRITILLTDSMADGIAGIFYGIDLFARDAGHNQLKESNARKMFYINYSLENSITRYGTLAHEFQHMVNFWQKLQRGGDGNYEETWLNEGLSKYAEEVCGYGILSGDANTARLIRLSQQNFAGLTLTNFANINSYGLSYLFVRFLAQENRYGTTYRDITRALVNSALIDRANVEAVTGENFNLTLAKWGLSLYLNRYSSTDPQEYGFSGLNLAGTLAGEALPGFVPVAVGAETPVSLKAYGVRCFVKTSSGAASTDFTLKDFLGDVDLWLFDERP